ncbi:MULTISPECIES: Mo-dependent nitrogenase C-terminal domain-containing protein [Nostocales]|jgi:tellurite resistance protein|uniref:Nitrogenase n=1 Tax=Aphanizomenon flos-aquae FACHB-1040 TaxID=2692887 RepID=A0ABR8BZJ8_APHFL|nr:MULTISPECIES: Mo-dependent nitrogenase C-terminal domain-containing protein [Nostocales]MBO1070864.1 nitrogenase [Dolichospermum sp. DEX189]MCX5981126.1 nitrogenase [Nostocales cyanobacterium LacPavin_0920_SED1_MAG_38_18]QSV70738.1 MAG: nitrogenase [Aphanizomenon flos-aquae KM1D3_PB]KHG43129.1 nitrogenase [Aphanizomenon flos-aquae 2012/KM1/D3]MBD2279231.1 nitrogenase [Aphanizomenon flos-aquae FACHB-1040]
MTTTAQTAYSSEQIIAWLRGLLTIAWADGNFDTQEQELITNLTKDELAPAINWDSLEIIEPDELAAILGKGTPVAENFLRTAVMVAIADGIYSPSEDDLLQQLCQKLELQESLLTALRHTLEDTAQTTDFPPTGLQSPHPDALTPLRQWLDGLDIQDPRVAKFLCKMIPSQCPFERDVTLFGRKIVHIPPLCKINPLYEQMVGLRFRALSYLADDCGEDVTPYI